MAFAMAVAVLLVALLLAQAQALRHIPGNPRDLDSRKSGMEVVSVFRAKGEGRAEKMSQTVVCVPFRFSPTSPPRRPAAGRGRAHLSVAQVLN